MLVTSAFQCLFSWGTSRLTQLWVKTFHLLIGSASKLNISDNWTNCAVWFLELNQISYVLLECNILNVPLRKEGEVGRCSATYCKKRRDVCDLKQL